MGRPRSRKTLDEILDLEREMQTAECRADRHRLVELLAPDFVEIGASSQVWNRTSIVQMLTEESRVDDEVIEVDDCEARDLAPDVVQVFWTSYRAGRRARRTSIWRRREGRWQLVYHQGTLIPE